MVKFLRLAFLCCIAISAAGRLYAQTEKTIWVEITDERGRPLPNVTVKSQDWGIPVQTTSSGRIGVPVSPNVRTGELIPVIIQSARYKTITGGPINVRVAGFNQPAAATPITLVPKINIPVRAINAAPARRLQPDDEDFQKGKDALHEQRFDYAVKHLLKSVEVRKRAYDKTPNKSTAAQYAEANTELCLAYMVLNKWNDAFERIQEAKRVNPTDEVKLVFGVVAMTRGDLPEAEAVFREFAVSKNTDVRRPMGAMLVSEIYKMYGKLDESSRFEKDSLKQLSKHELSVTKEINDLLKLTFEVASDIEKSGRLRQILTPVYPTVLTILHKSDIAVIEKNTGAYSPELVQPLLNFSSLLLIRGRRNEAERQINRAILVLKRLVGPTHVWMTQPLMSLAKFEIATNQLDKAEAHYLEVAQIFEQSLGPDNRWIDEIDEDLAELYDQRDRPDEAEARWQNSRKRNCSGDVKKMPCLMALRALSESYRFKEKYSEAAALGREAVNLAKTLWAAKDQVGTSVLLEMMDDLEEIYKLADQQDEVAAIQKEQQEILDLGLPQAEKDTESVELYVPETTIAQLDGYRCRTDFPNSFLVYSKSRPLLEAAGRAARHLDSRDPDVTELQYFLGLAYFNDERLDEAERLATAAINSNEASLEPDRRTTSLLLSLRGAVRAERGNPVGAIADYSESIKILEILDRKSKDIVSSLFSLSKIQISQQKYSEAEKNLKRALEIREQTFSCFDPDSVTLSTELAVVYVLTGHLAEAENDFKQALNAIRKFLPEYANSVYILENYARCLRQLGKVDEAVKLEAEAEKLKPKKQ